MKTKVLMPKLRNDLQLSLIEQDGLNFVVLKDPIGIASQPIALNYNFFLLLNMLNSGLSIDEFKSIITDIKDLAKDWDFIIEQINNLDNLFYLESVDFLLKKYNLEQEYLALPNRPMACVGNSYPYNKNEFISFSENLFNYTNKPIPNKKAKAIIVPHIDFSLGELSQSVYANAYQYIKDSDSDLFVIFGTSHYAFSDYFMLTKKNFETPMGIVETDSELIEIMEKELENSFIIDDLAHKPEHSIEFQVVLLKYLFPDKNFKILPILVGSFYEFIEQRKSPNQQSKINNFIQNFENIINKSGRKATYIASVDFSHIGRKFDDDFDADTMLDSVAIEDDLLIESIKNRNADAFFEKISSDKDKWKVCGSSPIYTMLKSIHFSDVNFIDYKQWNEKATESAVTFAGFALY